MPRSSKPAVVVLPAFSRKALCRKSLKAAAVLVLLTLAANQGTVAQCRDCGEPPLIDILGAHDDSGRGCVGCHALHVASLRSGEWVAQETGNNPRLEENAASAPDKKATFGGKKEQTVKVPPNVLAATTAERSGVLLCVSCHDGNLAPENMIANQSYDNPGGQRVPTLREGQGSWGVAIEHPLGPNAIIEVGNGLQFVNGVFSVIPGTPYAQFVASYGWPTLAPHRRSNPYGIDEQGRPYVVCTTCHNQHAMNVYVSRSGSPIAGDAGGQSYTTSSFVNGPYNPNIRSVDSRTSTSTVQFCRQCHFHLSNEANNTPNIPTRF
jgi:hypothetical protein